MIDTLLSSVPWWTWTLALFGIFVTFFGLPEAVSTPIKEILVPPARELGTQTKVLLRTRWGKTLTRSFLAFTLFAVCFICIKSFWSSQVQPTAENISQVSQQSSTNTIAQRAYDKAHKNSGECIFLLNPYVSRSDAPKEQVRVTTATEGNSLIFQVEITNPEESLRSYVGFRTMEFKGMQDHDGKWTIERSSWTRGGFESDDSFDASMRYITKEISKNSCISLARAGEEDGT